MKPLKIKRLKSFYAINFFLFLFVIARGFTFQRMLNRTGEIVFSYHIYSNELHVLKLIMYTLLPIITINLARATISALI